MNQNYHCKKQQLTITQFNFNLFYCYVMFCYFMLSITSETFVKKKKEKKNYDTIGAIEIVGESKMVTQYRYL